MFLIVLFLAVGILAGTTAGLLGVGGGLVFLPLAKFYFIDFLHYPQSFLKVIIATSTVVIVSNSLGATIQHQRQKRVDLSLLPYFAAASLIGAKIGVLLVDMVPIAAVKCILSAFLVVTAIRILRGKEREKEDRHLNKKSKWQIGALGVAISTLSSMLGLGGGALMGPLLHSLFGQSVKKAIANASLFTLTVSTFACLFYLLQQSPPSPHGHLMMGYIDIHIALIVSIGGFAGSWIGTRLLHRAPVELLQKLFAVLLLIAGIKMFI